MAKYVGKRVVPKHCGAWTKNKEYEMLSIVLDEASGESYISRRQVPSGTLLTDEYYWSICSLFSQQIADMGEEFEERQNQITQNNAETLRQIRADNDATETAIRDDNDATEQAVRDDNTATKQHVDAAVARSLADMEEAVSDVNATNAALNARMDGIAGQTTTDTEILDARTDAEGVAHANLGAHIRKADEDIQNIFDYGEALTSVPDVIRQKNLVVMMDASTTGTDGTTIIRAEAFGKADKAGTIINGVMGDAYGRTIFHITEPIHFEAGKTYSILINDEQKDQGAGSIFFYNAVGGSVLQQNGVNRGFTLGAAHFGQIIPDTTGDYKAGLYCHDFEFVDYNLHLYILEGEVSPEEYLSYAPYADLRNMLSSAASISDYARKNNMVHMRSATAKNNQGEAMVNMKVVSDLDPSVIVLNGQMGPAFSVIRVSDEFLIEEGETYTVYADDGGTGLNYNIMIADEFGTYIRNDDVVMSFNMLDNPYGQFHGTVTKKYHIRIQSGMDNTFSNYAVRVCVLKGNIPLEQIRSFAKFREGMDVVSLAAKYAGSLIRIKDEIRAKNLLPTASRARYDGAGNIVVKSESGSPVDGTITVINGQIGPSYISSTFPFTEYYDFEAGKEYTVYTMDMKQTVDYSIYFYNKDGGVMQQGGQNLGRYVLSTPLWYITPDSSGRYRAGIYAKDVEYVDHPIRFLMLEGHYEMKDIRDGFSIDEYVESAPGVVLTQPEVTKNSFVTTKDNYATDDGGNKVFTVTKTGMADRAGVVINGSLGPVVQRNNVVLSDSFDLKGDQTYTFYVDSDRSKNFYLWVADASTGAVIPMKDTVSFAFVTKSKPYGTFTPVSDVRAYIRMQVPDSMTFEQFRMHLYLLEGEVPLENITALVTPTMLEERASVLEAKLDSEIDLTASDADSFNFHGIHAQQVSDAARKQNLATVISGRRVNGDNALTCTGFGRLDPAGGVVSGTLNTESGLSTVYLTDYIEFEAGEKYTVYTDIPDKTVSFGLYFYKKDTGVVLQENGNNRGFNNRTEPFAVFTPDTSGLYRGGFYSSNCELDNVEFHVYVLKGEHTRDEFLGIASGPQIAESVSSMVKVKDWVRRENLVTCGSRGSINSAQTDLVTVLSVGAHDRAGAVVNGMLGASQNIPYFRYSEPFEVEAGKSYTVLMTDEDPDADYKIMFTLDPAASSVRQNGSVRYFDIRTEPFGLLIPDVSGPIRVNIYSQKDCSFDHHIFHVYVLEGVFSKAQLMATAEAGDSMDYEAFGLPVLKLTGSMAGVTKDVTGTFDYIYGDLSGSCTLKWQGGSSLSYPKKNFTVKFDQKFEAKEGWGQRKKYVLKANYIDFSHARNIVCAKLWGQVVKSRAVRNERLYDFPNGGAIDGFPCIMLLNGEFYGFYTFNTPKDEDLFGIGETTVDPETGEETPLPQAVFCADNHTTATQFKAHCVVDESDFSYKYVPDEDDFQWAKDSLDSLIDACLAADSEEAVDALADKVDLDSAIDYYIFTCLLGGGDMTDKNYIISTYDGVQWFFTAYDMDSVFGNHWTGKYYTKATAAPTFKSYANTHRLMQLIRTYKRPVLKARYAELRKGPMSEENVALTFENFMVDIPRAVLNKEVEQWPLIPGTNTNNLTQILDWYRLRVQALDAEIEAL
jgi:hypothetical protein